MSIPAETPAAVTMVPLSTKRSFGRGGVPVGRGRQSIKQPGVGENKGAGADARQECPVFVQRSQP
jgi:hypothetical protein